MNFFINISLNTNADQRQRLLDLQRRFAEVCSDIAAVVRQTHIWNRVALHHLVYKKMRERFPDLGSQMVCNAIYSVSRTCRLVFQAPESPFRLGQIGERPLPLLKFAGNCPVYFDRHTLSLKDGLLSLYTLDGRIRFQLQLGQGDEAAFREKKLREIVLSRDEGGAFQLSFWLSDLHATDDSPPEQSGATSEEIKKYVLIEELS